MNDGESFIHLDKDRITTMNSGRSDKWDGDMDMCSFSCNTGVCDWNNWRNATKADEDSFDTYDPH